MKQKEKLKKARIDAGLSMRQAAQKLGLKSANNIVQWESGKRVPKLENLKKLANAYGKDLMYFLEF